MIGTKRVAGFPGGGRPTDVRQLQRFQLPAAHKTTCPPSPGACERGGRTLTPVSDSGSPLLADEARQARQAALTSVAAALGLALCRLGSITSSGSVGGRSCCLDLRCRLDVLAGSRLYPALARPRRQCTGAAFGQLPASRRRPCSRTTLAWALASASLRGPASRELRWTQGESLVGFARQNAFSAPRRQLLSASAHGGVGAEAQDPAA